jgi:hemerythrin-like metal-binding protein
MNYNEHQDMEAIGRELSAVMSECDTDRSKVLATLNRLKATMILHFAHEEGVMKDANYPNYFHHRRSHTYIMTELAVFITSYSSGRTDTVTEIWPHLQRTLETHMNRYDRDLEAFFARTC